MCCYARAPAFTVINLTARAEAGNFIEGKLIESRRHHSVIFPTTLTLFMLELFKRSEAGSKPGWLERLKGGLANTRSQLGGLFVGRRIDEALFEDLESALLSADARGAGTQNLIA